jgi:hypothetical protein
VSKAISSPFVFVLAIALAVYFASVSGRRIHRFMSIETMDKRIESDLPKGSSIEQADKYLAENKVEHSIAWDGKMYGIIHWIWGSWIVQRDAQIIIHFQDGKVEKIEVSPVATFF